MKNSTATIPSAEKETSGRIMRPNHLKSRYQHLQGIRAMRTSDRVLFLNVTRLPHNLNTPNELR